MTPLPSHLAELPIPLFQDPHRILVLITCGLKPRQESHLDRLRQNEFQLRCASQLGQRVELVHKRCNTPLNRFTCCVVVLCNQVPEIPWIPGKTTEIVRSWLDRTSSSERSFVAAELGV